MLNVWNRRPFIAGQVCQQVHFVIFHLQHATHMNWKNAKDLFHVLPFLNKASCVYNLSPVAFVDPVCSKVVLRMTLVLLPKEAILLSICTGILGTFDILQLENWFIFLVWKQTGYFYQFKLYFFQVSELG